MPKLAWISWSGNLPPPILLPLWIDNKQTVIPVTFKQLLWEVNDRRKKSNTI